MDAVILRNKFTNILNIESTIYKNKSSNQNPYKGLKNEETFISNITDEETIRLLNILCNTFNMNDEISLLNDISNIASFNPITERINYLLLLKSTCITKDNFSLPLFNAMKKRILITNDIEKQIRKVFIYLLQKHIDTSNGMSEEYIDTLISVKRNILFKYKTQNIKSEKIDKDFLYKNIYEDYISSTIEVLINKILSFTDEELSIDFIYAQAILYQIMLRTVLVILNDYNLINDYEAYINNLENNNTIAKSMLKSAFITNNEDIRNIKKEKEYIYEK